MSLTKANTWSVTKVGIATAAVGVRKQLAKKGDKPEVIINEAQVDPAFSRGARGCLIQKVYEIDPLLCPHCGAEMRLMALIEDSLVIENILI